MHDIPQTVKSTNKQSQKIHRLPTNMQKHHRQTDRQRYRDTNTGTGTESRGTDRHRLRDETNK